MEDPFRLVVWNCNMAFHQKYEQLLALRPTVAVIPECAQADIVRQKAPGFAFRDVEWAGTYPNKGLSVFSFGEYTLRRHATWDAQYHIALPLEVRGPVELNLLALWAFNERAPATVTPNPATTEAALKHYAPFLAEAPGCVAGDFNANVMWDAQGRYASFASLDRTAEDMGLTSAYHLASGDAKGAEATPTFYWQKKRTQPYHIDYAYIPRSWMPRLTSVTVGYPDDWLAHSDHVPLVIELAPTAVTAVA